MSSVYEDLKKAGDRPDGRRLATDIEYFCGYFHRKQLTPKQLEFAHSAFNNDHTYMISTRQGGKTEIQALCAQFMLLWGTNVRIESYAPTQKQARGVVFDRLKGFFTDNDDLRDEVSEIRAAGEIVMHNGNKFTVQTANRESNIRGVSPTVIQIDESQHISDNKYNADIKGAGAAIKNLSIDDFYDVKDLEGDAVWQALRAKGITTRIWETGTPIGRNHFWDTYNSKNVYIITQPWTESPVTDVQFVMSQKEEIPPRQWEAEFMCIFHIDSDAAFNRADVLRACVLPKEERPPDHRNQVYVAGIDYGQKRDHTVMVILECIGQYRKMVDMIELDLHLAEWQIAERLDGVYQYWLPKYTLFDKTGPGKPFFENTLIYLDWMALDGWKYTVESKTELMRNMERALANERIELWDDDRLIAQFLSIEEHRSPSGLVQFEVPGKKAGTAHDDQVQATALAAMAAGIYMGDASIDGEVYRTAVAEDFAFVRHAAPNTPAPRGWDTGQLRQRTSRWDTANPWK